VCWAVRAAGDAPRHLPGQGQGLLMRREQRRDQCHSLSVSRRP
jgi:hypothetical protein